MKIKDKERINRVAMEALYRANAIRAAVDRFVADLEAAAVTYRETMKEKP